MTLGEIDARIAPVRALLDAHAPREALERLDDLVRQGLFAPDDMWRVWQCYSIIWYRMFDKEKSRAYAWLALTRPGSQPRIIQQIEYSDYLFFLHYFDDVTDAFRRELEQQYDRFAQACETFPHPLARHRHEKLRIGYLASAFKDSVLSLFTAQLFLAYDRSRFDVYAYQLSEDRDLYTDDVAAHVAGFRSSPRDADYAAVAQDIYRDEIDILFDLEVHGGGGRTMVVMCYRPAPVQVAGIGYMASSGTRAVDCFLGDPYCDPPGLHDEDFAEEILRLPHTHFCYTPSARAQRARRDYRAHQHVVFGSFNNFWKLTDHMLLLWQRILRAVPGSHLLLKNSSQKENALRMTRRRLLHLGFQPDEFTLEDVTADYLSRYQDVDIALDTYPYPGGGTTCDALYMGVPVITRYGRRHGTRFGFSLLENIGLGELACADDETYVAKAVALASDPARLARLHAEIPQMMQASPVMDAAAYVRDVEQAYSTIFARWQQAQAGNDAEVSYNKSRQESQSDRERAFDMGKANRRVNKKQQQRVELAVRQEDRAARRTLQEAYEAGDYADVINELARLVENGRQTTEDIYKGAYSYFMLGDYSRAAGMVTAVLEMSPDHIASRILLARICILENRISDGLAIFDFIFEHYPQGLTEEQREDAEDILDYYGRTEGERLVQEFPYVAQFLHIAGAAAPQAAPAPAPQAAPAPAAPAASDQPAPADVHKEDDAVLESVANSTKDAATERDDIIGKPLPLRSELSLLNVFAGAHFVAGGYDAAAVLLSAAIDLDSTDEETIRNLVILSKRMGRDDQALALTSKLPQTDFLVLDYLRKARN